MPKEGSIKKAWPTMQCFQILAYKFNYQHASPCKFNVKARNARQWCNPINISMELTFAARKSLWRRQYSGNPILTAPLPLLDLASYISLPVTRPSEVIFPPNGRRTSWWSEWVPKTVGFSSTCARGGSLPPMRFYLAE